MPIPRPNVEGPSSKIKSGWSKSNPGVLAHIVDQMNAPPSATFTYECVNGKIDITAVIEIIRVADFVRRPGFVFLRIETITMIFHTNLDCPPDEPDEEGIKRIWLEEFLKWLFVIPHPWWLVSDLSESAIKSPKGAVIEDAAVETPGVVHAVPVDGGVISLFATKLCGLPSFDDANNVVSCADNMLCSGECHVFGGPAGGEMKDLGKETEIIKGWVYYCDCV